LEYPAFFKKSRTTMRREGRSGDELDWEGRRRRRMEMEGW